MTSEMISQITNDECTHFGKHCINSQFSHQLYDEGTIIISFDRKGKLRLRKVK